MSKRRTGFVASIVVPLLGALSFAGCLGKARGGTDSETHFECAGDGDCRALGKGLVCVQGFCSKADSTALSTASKDAGRHETGTPAASSPRGTALPSPVTLTGTITIRPGVDVSLATLGVALAWHRPTVSSADSNDPECPAGLAEEELSLLQPTETRVDGSGRFTIQIREMPPTAALMDLSTSPTEGPNNIAVGAVLVYADGNGDGKFEFGNLSRPSPDVVYGTSSPADSRLQLGEPPTKDTYRITYADRPLPNYGPPYLAGFHVEHWSDYDLQTGETLPITSEIRIVLGNGLRTRELACGPVCYTLSTRTCPDSPSGLPPGGYGTCSSPSGPYFARYSWQLSTCSGCHCDMFLCSFGLDPMGPVRSDWPCGPSDGGS